MFNIIAKYGALFWLSCTVVLGTILCIQWRQSVNQSRSSILRHYITYYEIYNFMKKNIYEKTQSGSSAFPSEYWDIHCYLMADFYDFSTCPQWFCQSVKELYAAGGSIYGTHEKYERSIIENSSFKFFVILSLLENELYCYEDSDDWIIKEKEIRSANDDKYENTNDLHRKYKLLFKEYDILFDNIYVYIIREHSLKEIKTFAEPQNVKRCMNAFEMAMSKAESVQINCYRKEYLYCSAFLAKSYSVPDDFLKLFREHLVSMADNEGNQERQKEIWQELKNTVQSQY